MPVFAGQEVGEILGTVQDARGDREGRIGKQMAGFKFLHAELGRVRFGGIHGIPDVSSGLLFGSRVRCLQDNRCARAANAALLSAIGVPGGGEVALILGEAKVCSSCGTCLTAGALAGRRFARGERPWGNVMANKTTCSK